MIPIRAVTGRRFGRRSFVRAPKGGDHIWRPVVKDPSKSRPIDYRSLFVLNRVMSVILEINRDFPYQIALPFDEDAMDVLDWLEGCEFQWDMYVDLPENTVRYHTRAKRARDHQEKVLDDALKNTFPASDPISIEQPTMPTSNHKAKA